MERSKGFSSWIRFGEKSLSLLLEGVEAWCRGGSNLRHLKVWEEGGRKFRLDCRSNVAGRFLLCSVRDLEAKKFCLVFPEGNGLVGGWFLLSKKLRALGVCIPVLTNSFQFDPTAGKVGSIVKGLENESGLFAEVVKRKTEESRDSLRVHLGERELLCREEQLGRCLMGCFGGSPESIPLLPSLKRWALKVGCLRGI